MSLAIPGHDQYGHLKDMLSTAGQGAVALVRAFKPQDLRVELVRKCEAAICRVPGTTAARRQQMTEYLMNLITGNDKVYPPEFSGTDAETVYQIYQEQVHDIEVRHPWRSHHLAAA